MSLPDLIGITGAAGSGKDTLADHILYETKGTKYSFAYPIKKSLNEMFGWKMNDWDNREWKEAVIPRLGKSPRQLAQTLGTEWGRDTVHPELWILLAEDQYKRQPKFLGAGPFIIPDVRFDNEARKIRELGGAVVRVVRYGIEKVNAHVSEHGVSDRYIDHTFHNNGSIAEFVIQSLYILKKWSRDI